MKILENNIVIISAPSILGLKPTGVEELATSLLHAGLAEKLQSVHPVIQVPTLNVLYSNARDQETHCLNDVAIRDFSLTLGEVVSKVLDEKHFALVLGGDCSILIGCMSALKAKGPYGLIFLDAHADFYAPEQSMTGEVADMDLAIVTGRGPTLLTNLQDLQPYVQDEHVIHIGQRDQAETREYGSNDIRETAIKCFSLDDIEQKGLSTILPELVQQVNELAVEGLWIHFDTDVLSDDINPAVDYRLPGGLTFEQVERLLQSLLLTKKIVGMSVTIFNPKLDKDGSISRNIVESLHRAFSRV